ncbi:hypothetical protein P43SY_010901 [Pythium insidiosum]|uniref:Reverse transcriptase domain-containing protein n=1 Tax=Pythium insidiosum TaxID=114742 RepID=A0AAD5Q4T9_PYTIN|nr:hypothetical protein P43SY_010901 [Pythium insidiosum]
MEAQLDLVQLYCEGSGAKLNLSKCVVLPLHRRRHVAQLGAVRVLERGETVKYLGIPFGQASVVQALLDDLDRKFYEGFKLPSTDGAPVAGDAASVCAQSSL